MNEKILVRFEVNGKRLKIDSFGPDGVVLAGESSASPRGLAVYLAPGNAITEFRWRRVRQIEDWRADEFKLVVGLEDGALAISGVNATALPEGAHSLRVEVSDLIAVDQPADVKVPFGGAVEAALRYNTDKRSIKVAPLRQFDAEIRRVIDDPASILDGKPAADWLYDPAPRPARKACLLNVLAKLRVAAKSRLIADVDSLFFAEVDRVYARVGPGYLAQLQALAADPKKPFYFEGSPKAPIHQRLLAYTGPGELFSFRQEGSPSFQSVVAVPNAGGQLLADLDLDLGNPLQDLAGAVVHFGELLSPNKTDHLGLAKKLAQGPTGDFSYYEVKGGK